MKSHRLAFLFALTACSSPPANTQPDAAVPRPDAASACSKEPVVHRDRFIAESIAYLRESFGVTDGFEGGHVAYSEAYVALTDAGCPIADWTALSYVTAIAPDRIPTELRDYFDRVAVVWALNGRKFVVFLSSEGDVAPWPEGRLPDNVNALANADADPRALDELVKRLTAAYPALVITYLEEIGVLTLEATVGNFGDPLGGRMTVREINAATDELRQSGLFSSIEWSPLNFRWPNEFWPAQRVDSEWLEAECARTRTTAMMPAMNTSPSLAAPLGTGPVAKTPTCQ